MPEFDYSPTTECKAGMTRNEVVDVLQGQIELLRNELERRDEVIDGIMDRLPKDIEECQEIDDLSRLGLNRCKAELSVMKIICAANLRIHDDLRPVAADIRRRMAEAANAWDQTDG